MELVQVIQKAGLPIVNGKVQFPSWAKRLKIDVGLSNSAPNAIKWILDDPALVVIGVEPIGKSVTELNKLLSELPSGEIIKKQLFILQIALSERSGEQEIYVTADNPDSSSLIQPKHMPISRKEKVATFTLSDILGNISWEEGIGRVDHLKLDCQGLDLKIIKSAGELIKRIAVVTAEADTQGYGNIENSSIQMARYFQKRVLFSPISDPVREC